MAVFVVSKCISKNQFPTFSSVHIDFSCFLCYIKTVGLKPTVLMRGVIEWQKE